MSFYKTENLFVLLFPIMISIVFIDIWIFVNHCWVELWPDWRPRLSLAHPITVDLRQGVELAQNGLLATGLLSLSFKIVFQKLQKKNSLYY